MRIASVREVPGFMTPAVVVCRPAERASVVTAVGQHEDALSSVRSAGVGRGDHSPFRIEPQRGKVSDDGVESQPNVACDVLEADERRGALVDDPPDLGPQVSLVLVSESLPSDGEGLTRVARRDEIHDSTPRAAVEGSEVVEDRRRIQGRLFHPGHKDGRSEGVPLDDTHKSQPGEGGAESKLEPADPGT
jgi:hypothetical protein